MVEMIVDGKYYNCKHIKGFEEYYATPSGNIISCRHKDEKKIMKGYTRKRGKCITLRRGKLERKEFIIKNLIAEMFLERKSTDSEYVRYIDGNINNNSVSNLCYVDKSEVSEARSKSAKIQRRNMQFYEENQVTISHFYAVCRHKGLNPNDFNKVFIDTYVEKNTGRLVNRYNFFKIEK